MHLYNVSAPWASMEGNWEPGPLYAGTSCALVRAIEPLDQLLERIVAEAEVALGTALNDQQCDRANNDITEQVA